MAETQEQAQLREHLHELRRATAGLGRDFKLEFEDLDTKIARLGRLTAKETKYALIDIHDDFARVGRAMDDEMRKLPHQVGAGLTAAGQKIEDGTVRLAGATKDALESAGHAAKEGTKNAFASAAGLRRTPMKEWHTPSEESG